MENKVINYGYSTLKELYKRELNVRNVNQTDIQFVLSLIRESDVDENLSIMDNDYWEKLLERDLLKIFEEINEKFNIDWNHSNEEAR